MMLWLASAFEMSEFEAWVCPETHDCHLRIKARLVEVHRRIMRNADLLEMLKMLTEIDEEEGDFENENDYWSGEMPEDICEDCESKWASLVLPIRAGFFKSLRSFFPTE